MEKPAELNDQELRKQQTEKVFDFLNRTGAYEYVQHLISHKGEKPPFEVFRDFVVRLNGIARDIPIDERKPDGDRVYLAGFDEALVPKQIDKEPILADAYAAVERVQPGDEAYLLPAVINAIHLFADGNGRTSRIFHILLTKFESEVAFEDELRKAVGEDGRYETEDINPSIVRISIDKIILLRHGFAFENDTDWSPLFPDGFTLLFASSESVTSDKGKVFMDIRRVDQPYCFIAAHEYLKEKNMVSDFTTQVGSGIALSPSKMDQSLTNDDWDEIMKRYHALKKEHVEILIDAFVKPEEYKNLTGTMNLKDFFIGEIKNKLAK